MAYIQVKDILVHAEKLREFLKNYARRHELKADNDLLAGLFQEVNQHERQLGICLSEFQSSTSQELQQTWIQFSGVEEVDEAMDGLSAVDELENEKVLEKLLEAEEALQRVYKLAKEQADAAKLQELFGELYDLQDHHLRYIANCISEYGQMRRD